MKRISVHVALLGVAGLILVQSMAGSQKVALAADQPSVADIEFFSKKIKPVLEERCYECHSSKAKKVKGKLKMDTKEDFLKGGEDGKIVEPGNPEKSMIIKAISWEDEDTKMPPKKKLSDE